LEFIVPTASPSPSREGSSCSDFYGQPGFLDVTIFGHNLRELFQIKTINLSTAVWVGFIALFGIATDDGVVISTYLRQRFKKDNTI